MNLEQQLAELARLGLSLDAGITIEDLLVSRTRADYERIPFRHLLRVLGDETEGARRGRRICPRAWTFDTECIVDARDYVPIVKRLAEMAGASDRLRDVEVEVRGADASLRYVLDDEPRRVPIVIADDWADLQALCTIMAGLASGEERFFGELEGQGAYLFFLTQAGEARVNELAGGHMVLSSVADWVHAAPSRPKRRQDAPARVDPTPLADAIASYVSESRAVPYETSRRFAVNDQLSHPVFGAGIVVRSGHTQIDVLFGDGLRTLAHARG
jgi:hypothetical protein